MAIESVNPATGKLVKTYQAYTTQEWQEILTLTTDEQVRWRQTSFQERAKLLESTATVLRHHKNDLALLMTTEMGKPLQDGMAEVEKCTWVCEYYAQHAEAFLKNQFIETEAAESFVSFQPIGVVLAVMPWNFPFWQVFRFAAPALMAGNGAVLKHASNVPGCALAIESIFREAGLPENIFRTLLIEGKGMEAVVKHPAIKAVTLTGSTPAGKSVAAAAGSVIKKTVLELGGSDPYLILADADLDLAAQKCAQSRMINNGQSCIAAKRFIIVEEVYQKFEEKLVEAMKRYTMGDPLKDETKLGPMARMDLRDEVHKQVTESIGKGAKCLLGGAVPSENGAWYPATVLSRVQPGMPAYDEEIFGPVASLIQVKDETEAIKVANDTNFGLGAAVFTNNFKRGIEIAEKQLEAGCCFVNDFVKSDPRLPFGGIKESGYGRELSPFGIREFVNIKTVYRA